MSLTQERIAELSAIATQINQLTTSEANQFNGYYEPDILVYGCDQTLSENIDVEQLATDCEGLSYEEIEFIHTQLLGETSQHRHIGIKPGASPGGSPSGNK